MFKVLYIDSASLKWPFLGSFGPLLPQIWSEFAEIFTKDKRRVWAIFENLKCYRNRTDQKFVLLVQLSHYRNRTK